MFAQLVDELLDLRVAEKGFGDALFATTDDPGDGGGGGCSCSCSYLCISLCCV